MKKNAISTVASISIVVILIAIVGFGAYFAYSSNILTGSPSSTPRLATASHFQVSHSILRLPMLLERFL